MIEAPTITGSESKNAKSDDTEWFNFRSKPALIVTPNLLMPAKSAKLCPNPIATEVFALTRLSISASESCNSAAISR